METEGLSEEEMIDSLFYRCDVHDEGRVQISTIIQFLKNCLGNGNNEPDLVKLASILEEKSNEGNINFMAYRSGVKLWIAEIRQRCKSTNFLESDSLIMVGDNGDLINSTDQIDELLSGCIETSGIGDGPNRNEQDIGDLLGQLEDLKFQNRKLVEENAKLHYQLESQEETSSALASDIQNRRQEEEQLKKKVKSLQEIVELRQSVIDENEELKNKMKQLKDKKKEFENKVMSLERDNMNLENQTRSLENKWQRSQQELEVVRKELQELQNTCTEQKDLLLQTQEQKNSKDTLLSEKSTELAALKEKFQELVESNEKLEEERDHIQTVLSDTQAKVQRLEVQFENLDERENSITTGPSGSKEKSKLTPPKHGYSTPLHRNSICMELKDRLDESKHLPSPLCEKMEISKDFSSFLRPVALPPYMSAWELDVTNGSVPDYSLELLKSRRGSGVGVYEVDMEKKLLGLKNMEKDALHREIIKLYRLNVELAEKCHRAEVREEELQEMVTQANKKVDTDKLNIHSLEENLQRSRLAREVDLKDLWRIVHVDDEKEYLDSQSDSSEVGSSEYLKHQITQEIETLKNRLHKREAALGALSCTKGKVTFAKLQEPASSSPLVDALAIDFPANKKKLQSRKPCREITPCKDCQRSNKRHLYMCSKSVPLMRRNSRVHDIRQHLNVSSSSSTSGIGDLEYTNSAVMKVNNKRISKIKFIDDDGDSDVETSQSVDSNWTDIEDEKEILKAVMEETKTDSLNPLGHVLTEGQVLRRPSYTTAISNETSSVEDVHIPRSRSYSFQTAIEQGQISPTGPPQMTSTSSIGDTTPENETTETSWNSAPSRPRFSSTPLPESKPPVKSVAFHPHTVKPYNANNPNNPKIVTDRKISKPGELNKSDINENGETDSNIEELRDYQDKEPSKSISMSLQAELIKTGHYKDNKSLCSSNHLSILLEEETQGTTDTSCHSSPALSVSGIKPAAQHISSFLGSSGGLGSALGSAEFWTLSRSSNTRQTDSGHSSSLTSAGSFQQKESDIKENFKSLTGPAGLDGNKRPVSPKTSAVSLSPSSQSVKLQNPSTPPRLSTVQLSNTLLSPRSQSLPASPKISSSKLPNLSSSISHSAPCTPPRTSVSSCLSSPSKGTSSSVLSNYSKSLSSNSVSECQNVSSPVAYRQVPLIPSPDSPREPVSSLSDCKVSVNNVVFSKPVISSAKLFNISSVKSELQSKSESVKSNELPVNKTISPSKARVFSNSSFTQKPHESLKQNGIPLNKAVSLSRSKAKTSFLHQAPETAIDDNETPGNEVISTSSQSTDLQKSASVQTPKDNTSKVNVEHSKKFKVNEDRSSTIEVNVEDSSTQKEHSSTTKEGDSELVLDITTSLNCMTLDSPPKTKSDPPCVGKGESKKTIQNGENVKAIQCGEVKVLADEKQKPMQNGEIKELSDNKKKSMQNGDPNEKHEKLSSVSSEQPKVKEASINNQTQDPLKKTTGIENTTSSSNKVGDAGRLSNIQDMVKNSPPPSANMSVGSSPQVSLDSRLSSVNSTSSETMPALNNNNKPRRQQQMIIEDDDDSLQSRDHKTESSLSKLRETHLARRRDQQRIRMPQLSELAERDGAVVQNGHGEEEEKLEVVQPPSPNDDSVMPSIPDEFLSKLGLTQDGPGSDELSDQEIESKFTSLSLAFKTDSQTLEKRLEIQERSRDIAEQNVDKELQALRSGLTTLNQICTDPQVREVLTKIQNHIDVLEKSTARVSSRAEVLGAIQQERRMSKAVDIMVHHVENLRRVHEREHAELEEAKKLLQDSRSLGPTSVDVTGNERMLSRRSASVCPSNILPGQSSRRRVSEIALPKVLGGAGAPNLHLSASMDARSRFQAAVASTAVKSTVANTLRRASLERQNPVVQQSPTSTPDISRDNSQDKGLDAQEKEKQKNLEEEAFKKGYEQGMRASLGQDLSGLREQQNQINQSLGDIMDSIDNNTEEPKSLKEILLERADSLVPKVKLSGRRIRMTFGCFFIVMAIISVIVSLFPVGSASLVGFRHYGRPPL